MDRDAPPPDPLATTTRETPELAATLADPDVAERQRSLAPTAREAADRYAPLSLLGVGGMGEVHLCADRVIGREVARKRIRTDLRSTHAYRRFAREALVQARLEHPAIVPVYDVALDESGEAWFTMKRIRGRTLAEILVAHRDGDAATIASFSRRRLLSSFVQLCLAIDYAHQHGVIHRDLKPGNVMLGDFGEIHVLDWGLAHIAGEPDGGEIGDLGPLQAGESGERQTLVGAPLGTPGYMSPEQARGEHHVLDRRTDVYSLGAILFEILTLEPLIPGTHLTQVLMSTLQGVDARPSSRGVEVAPELDAACVRATALDRAERHASARELAGQVERYLDGDRDLERRRTLAREHVDAARAHLGAGEPDRRGAAIRELGRAVALDPTSEEGLGLLAKELLEPPATLPSEGLAELETMRNRGRRAATRTAALRFAAWALFLPLAFWMGVRDWTLTSTFSGVIVVCAIAAALGSRRATHDARVGVALLAASSLVIGLVAALFGPLILVPALAATNAMYFAMNGEARHRWLAPTLNVLAIVVPFALEALGWIAPSYTFDGAFVVRERATYFPALPTTVTLLVTAISIVVIPTALAGRMRDALNAAEDRLFRQAFHLRQMVPTSARPANARSVSTQPVSTQPPAPRAGE